jgi:LCP family protein required for cell wall assembly
MRTRTPPVKRPLNPPRLPGDDAVPTDGPLSPVRRKRRGRRLLWAAVIGIIVALLWVSGSTFLFSSRLDRLPSSELTSLTATTGGPVNYLLVGSDSRADLAPEFGDWFGDFGGRRADVIILLHSVGGRLQLLSLPRDLKVEIPGHGVDRINAAFAFGGPDLLVQTVQAATGLPVHHYLEVGFGDFADVVDGLGGVSVNFPYAARDNKSGLSVEAGTSRLDGIQAVAYVRSRSYEELRDGTWVAVDQGDIARTRRQQQVVAELLGRARSPGSLIKLPLISASVGDALAADAGLSMFDLARLGWAVGRGGVIESATLPVRDSVEGGVAYVVRAEPSATAVLEAFAAGDTIGDS